MSEQRLIDWLGSVSNDPLAFVMGAFPWGEPETRLANEEGPEEWQRRILILIRNGLPLPQAIQLATASGHGVGKSALVAWVILWSMSTAPNTRGVVTANTETQLKTKTWVELGKWFHMFIGKDLFSLTATQLFAKSSATDWRFDLVPWSERNTEAFAGLHNKGRRIVVIFDEASAIPDIIWETTEGALTDANTQIIWAVFGNPTRNTGRFRECFPGQRFASVWTSTQVDSRSVRFTNKDQISRWITAYGDDSDFVRIRVLGVFPRTGEMEFIPHDVVQEACSREAQSSLTDPLVMGVDVARYGQNESVIAFRKGRDARTIPWRFFRGLSTTQLAAQASALFLELGVDGVFVDGGGVGGGVVDNLRDLHVPVFDINFGAKPDLIGFTVGVEGEVYANKRAEMWGMMREWLKTGSIEDDPELRAQLVGPTFTLNLQCAIQLEKKEDMTKRGLESPDRADALALTFALPVQAHANAGREGLRHPLIQHEYNPFSEERMAI